MTEHKDIENIVNLFEGLELMPSTDLNDNAFDVLTLENDPTGTRGIPVSTRRTPHYLLLLLPGTSTKKILY
eukprot:scaffold221898_cov38-Attheya_sp.AAC.1